MKTLFIVIIIFQFNVIAWAQGTYVIEGATLINGVYNGPLHDAVLIVSGGKIAGVGTKKTLIIPGGAQTIDARGKFIIPGLIDAHIHYDSPHDLVKLLAWGVTSANCMFESTNDAVRIEQQTAQDTAHSPQIYATAPIFSTEHGWWWGKDFPLDSSINRFPASPEEAREQVRKVSAKGIKRIKLMYDSMDWCRDPLKPFDQMKPEIMQALIDEANKLQLFSEVHAPKLKDAQAAVSANCSALVHGILDERFDAPFIVTMQERGIAYVPTFCVFEFLADADGFVKHVLADDRFRTALSLDLIKKYSSEAYSAQYRERFPNIGFVRSHLAVLLDNTSALVSNYMPITMGTDMSAFPGIGVHLELEYMVQAGLTPMQAISAATVLGAQFLRMESSVGSIEYGKRADILLLDADPLKDIRNTRSISMIMKHGRIFDRQQLLEESKR